MLHWDETDFIECLEVLPEYCKDKAGVYVVFNILKAGIELELTVSPFEEDIRFRMFREGQSNSIFEYQILGCKVAEYRKENGQEYLYFENGNQCSTTVSVNPDIEVLVSEKYRL